MEQKDNDNSIVGKIIIGFWIIIILIALFQPDFYSPRGGTGYLDLLNLII